MKPAVILPILLDVVVPIGGYFLLHALGMTDFWALTIAGAGTGVAAIAVGGVFVLGTCLAGRPLVYETGKPFATKGDPLRVAAYEQSWQHSPKFRQLLTGITVVWGIGFLLVSAATVAIVLHFPPDAVSRPFALSSCRASWCSSR